MLNPLSILLITVLSGAMAMAVLGSLWRAAIPGVGYWISANAVAIVALLAFAMQGHASRWLTFVGANELLAISLLLVVEGCWRFLGPPHPALARLCRRGRRFARASLVDLRHAGLQRARRGGVGVSRVSSTRCSPC